MSEYVVLINQYVEKYLEGEDEACWLDNWACDQKLASLMSRIDRSRL